MTNLRVRNWEKFQHYKDRGPRWIKLYTELLDDPRFIVLPDAAKGQLCTLFLLAAKRGNVLPAKPGVLRILLGCTGKLYLDILLAEGWLEEAAADAQRVTRAPWASRAIPEDVRQQLLAESGDKCIWCGATKHLEIDHIVPVSRGGTSDKANLQVLCRSCNRSKRTRTNAEHKERKDVAEAEQTRSKNGAALREGEKEGEKETPTPPAREGLGFANQHGTDPRFVAFVEAVGPKRLNAWTAILDQWQGHKRLPLGLTPSTEQILDSLAAAVTANDGGPISERFVVRCIEDTVKREPHERRAQNGQPSSFLALHDRQNGAA